MCWALPAIPFLPLLFLQNLVCQDQCSQTLSERKQIGICLTMRKSTTIYGLFQATGSLEWTWWSWMWEKVRWCQAFRKYTGRPQAYCILTYAWRNLALNAAGGAHQRKCRVISFGRRLLTAEEDSWPRNVWHHHKTNDCRIGVSQPGMVLSSFKGSDELYCKTHLWMDWGWW